jgi:1-phosphofructokinase
MSEAPKGTVVNSVGAGDSMVAGFVAGVIETGDMAKAFRMGLCTGSASAFSPDLATRPEVEALLATL